MAKTATKLLRRLMTKADLSNQVSINALVTARTLWADYTDTDNDKRYWAAVKIVLAQLDIIVSQVCGADNFGIPSCRINPVMRADLAALVTMLRHSLATGTILEPKPMPMPEPANDDDADDKEAA